MTLSTFDAGQVALGELAVRVEREVGERNEATTRLQIIDVILFDALQWNRNHCRTEEPLDGSYTDYSMGAPATQLIVEAKKEGVAFNLPSAPGPTVMNLATLTRGNDGLASAIRQATSYCAGRGVRLAAVTNGHQLVAFLGSRDDGTAPLRGRAVVFRSLRDMEEHFVDLWNWLSPEGVSLGNLFELLRAETAPPPPQKLSQRLYSYPGVKKRNEIEIELDILGELFLQDIVRARELEDEFLRKCYCSSGALSQYALVTRDILKSRYHETVNRKTQQVTGATTNTGITPELYSAVLSRGVSRRPIILLGDVGVGKTTFIRHLVRIDAKEELERSLVFYIDFGAEPALRRDLEAYVQEAFANQLTERYGIDIHADEFVRATYNGELNRFASGIYKRWRESDPDRYADAELAMLAGLTARPEGHLRRSLAHLKATQDENAVVFFDNIDQRDSEFQDAVYLIAQGLSETWSLTCFVSLRPETFYESRRSGSLAAYAPRVFTISPPQIDQVVKRRLRFAQEVISAGQFSLVAEGITLDSSLLRDYISVLIASLDRNEQLCECLDNVSRGNVRQALDLLTVFVGSGHVDTRKILAVYRGEGRYVVPLHEFLRAIIYGDREYYDPRASPIPNTFDVTTRNPREHFAQLVLLNLLERQAQHGAVELGFVLLAQVYERCKGFGYTVDEVDIALTRAVESGLVESSVGAASERPADAERVRLTQLGAYLLHRLVHAFVYYDAVVVDTPILLDEDRPLLTDARHIQDRLDRADHFVDYLDKQFASIESMGTDLDWASIAGNARADIQRVRERLDRAEARRRL